MVSVNWHDSGSLTLSGFQLGGPSFDDTQDCIFGRFHHGGALVALGGRFRPKIHVGRCTVLLQTTIIFMCVRLRLSYGTYRQTLTGL